jgi:hypothetical protein
MVATEPAVVSMSPAASGSNPAVQPPPSTSSCQQGIVEALGEREGSHLPATTTRSPS